MPMSRRSAALVLAAALVAVPLSPAKSAPGSPVTGLSPFEVTQPSGAQQAEVDRLHEVLAAHGIEASGIRVFVVPEADGPATYTTPSPEQFRVQPAGGGAYEVLPIADARRLPSFPGVPVQQQTAAGGAQWRRNNQNCFRVSKDWFSRWVCWAIDDQTNDAAPDRDFWQYTQESTGSANSAWKMKRLWVEGKPGAPMNFDGIPEPKESTPKQNRCRSESDSVALTVGSGQPVQTAFTHTWNRTTCEEYLVKHYDDQAHWSTIWQGEPLKSDQARHVIFVMPVSTLTGQLPNWTVWSGQHRD